MIPVGIAQLDAILGAGLFFVVLFALFGFLAWLVGVYLTGYFAAWGWHDHVDRR